MADPRDYVNPTVVGTPLRDGAVDPREGDFLGPLNAGLPGSGSRSVGEVMETRVAPEAFTILSAHNLLFNAPSAGGWSR
jgi:hypothetical protein